MGSFAHRASSSSRAPPTTMGLLRETVVLVSFLLACAYAGMSIERPWGFSRSALNFAREEGTGTFYTTGSFRGTMVLGRKDVCNVQTCYKVPSLKMQSIGPSDIWLAKYNARNQLVW